MLSRGMRALAPLSVLALVAGCTASADSEPAPTETVTATATETVTASPDPAPTVTETVTATPEPEETEEPAGGAEEVPPYEVTQSPPDEVDSPEDRNIRVEVDSTDGIRAVFEDVISDIDEEGGWHVLVNCSTGGSAAADNRLGNGAYAIGDLGAAQTGLDAGESEFETLSNRQCPAS